MNNQWYDLPQELVDLIANHLHSNVELLRFRTICKPWRSAVLTKKRFHNRYRKRILAPFNERKCVLSPAAFFRVVLSSHPNEGWLIKTQDVSESGKNQLLSPLSRLPIKSTKKTVDLLDYTVSEIHQSYDIQYSVDFNNEIRCNFARVIPVKDLVFGVTHSKQIWCLKSGEQESSDNNAWTRIKDEEVELFSDIVFHKGQIYALDLTGASWWISKSDLEIFQYGPSTPMNYYDIDLCKDKRIVECGGELCVVHRFCKSIRFKRVDVEMTIGFKVYKMDGELCEYVEVKSLGDKAFVMGADSCFSVSAGEYYGCLQNSIYFTDEEKKDNVKVFKLDDGSITKMIESEYQSCFQMFSPSFA